jgi:hypothetical protein
MPGSHRIRMSGSSGSDLAIAMLAWMSRTQTANIGDYFWFS